MDVFVRLDKSGRVVLPKKIRENINVNEFSISLEEGERIVFTPVKTTNEMFGGMPDLDLEGFRREHKKER